MNINYWDPIIREIHGLSSEKAEYFEENGCDLYHDEDTGVYELIYNDDVYDINRDPNELEL